MRRIASRDNAVFKALRRVARDARAERVLLEGIHLCDAFLAAGGVPREVFVGASAVAHPEVVALLARSTADTIDRYVLDDALYAGASGLAQGVTLLMTIDRPRPAGAPVIVATSVVLDRIQDPGNVGSILRSAAAAGIADVFLSTGCASGWSPKVLRAGMGAHFHLRLFEDCDLRTLRERTTIGWLATSPHASRTIHEAELAADVAWVFGHEGQGLDPHLIDDASAVRIPQPGRGESLNVAAAAAICFFEQVRQRRAVSPRDRGD